MLPVNINQNLRELSELFRRHCLSTDFTLTTVFHNLPLQNKLPFLQGKLHFLNGFDLRGILHGKYQFYQRVLRPRADHLLIRLCPKRQIDGSDDNGFSGTRLAGQNIESAAERNLRLVNQSQIFHM